VCRSHHSMEAKRPRIFYGWWMVGATVLVGLYTGGIIVYGFTAIFEPIIDEFGWSYATVSFAASLRGAESGLLEPVVGRLVDRWGSRRLIFIGGLFTAAGLFLLSATRSLTMFYGAFVLLAVGMSACGPTSLSPESRAGSGHAWALRQASLCPASASAASCCPSWWCSSRSMAGGTPLPCSEPAPWRSSSPWRWCSGTGPRTTAACPTAGDPSPGHQPRQAHSAVSPASTSNRWTSTMRFERPPSGC